MIPLARTRYPLALLLGLAALTTIPGPNSPAAAPPGSPHHDGSWSFLGPPARFGHGASYQPSADRMVIVCGSDGALRADAWALSFATGQWSQFAAAGDLVPRRGALTAYDSKRERVLVYGGETESQALSDLWELSLSSRQWQALAPQGPSPGPRRGGASIYDPIGDRVLLFGGTDAEASSDVWELSLGSTPAWRKLELASGPSPVGPCSGVYDPIRHRLIVQTGNTAWALALIEGSSWESLSTITLPLPFDQLNSFSLTYDAAGDRLVLCGGQAYNPNLDVYVLSLASPSDWTTLPVQGTPPRLVGHTAVYDPGRGRIVTFGGIVPNRNKAYALTLGGSPSWSLISAPPGADPHGRTDHSAIYDSRRNRMLMWGGNPGPAVDVYQLSLDDIDAGWGIMPTSNVGPAFYQGSAVYDARRDRVLVFGGTLEDAYGSVWELALAGSPTWTKLAPDPAFPLPRQWTASVILDPVRDRLVLFGGAGQGGLFNDTWALELSPVLRWVPLGPDGVRPSQRWAAAAIYDPVGRRMVLFAGNQGGTWDTAVNDVWSLNLDGAPAWTLLSPSGEVPDPQVQCAAIYDPIRRRMVVTGEEFEVVGGEVLELDRTSTWALSLKGAPEWDRLEPRDEAPSHRYGHVAIYDPSHDRQVVFGGTGQFTGDTWFLDWRQQPATTTATTAARDQTPITEGDPDVPFKGMKLAVARASAGVPIELRVTLRESGAASLELIDVAGRRVDRRSLGVTGVGEHRASLSAPHTPGVYFVRLVQGESSLTRRIAVLPSR